MSETALAVPLWVHMGNTWFFGSTGYYLQSIGLLLEGGVPKYRAYYPSGYELTLEPVGLGEAQIKIYKHWLRTGGVCA